MQSEVGKLPCNKTALKRCTSTETLWNRKAPSLSSPEDEIFLPKLPKSYYYYAAFNAPCVGLKDDESQAQCFQGPVNRAASGRFGFVSATDVVRVCSRTAVKLDVRTPTVPTRRRTTTTNNAAKYHMSGWHHVTRLNKSRYR